MATWSADGKEVPAEVRAALAPGGALADGPADAHVHVRSGVGSLLGDTHLILAGGRFRVVGRKTSLDPFAEIELSGRPRLDDSGYRPILVLPTREGDQHLEVTALEEPAVEDLIHALPPLPAFALGAGGADGTELPSEEAVRAAFVGVLVRRLKQRRATILARRHARQTAALDHRVGTQRTSSDRWRSRHGRRTTPSERPAAAVASPQVATPARLLLLLLLGAAVFGLFAFLGRALAGQP